MTFDYLCSDCGGAHERVFSVSVVPPPTVECPLCTHVAYRVWSAPHVHVAASEFLGKFGVYKNDRQTNALRDENWNPPEDTTAKVNINGCDVATFTLEQAKSMKAVPPRKVKKPRP